MEKKEENPLEKDFSKKIKISEKKLLKKYGNRRRNSKAK